MNPAIVVCSGKRAADVAARALGLSGRSPLVRLTTQEAAVEDLTTLAGQVPGKSVVLALHVIDVDTPESELDVGGCAKAVALAGEQFPAIYLVQVAVLMVGQDFDDHEVALVRSAEFRKFFDGVYLVGRSTEAVALISSDEERQMASDVVYALLASEAGRSRETARVWTVGAAAVYFRRRVIVAAVGSYHAARFLSANLLAPRPHDDAFGAQGRAWVSERNLGDASHHDQLAVSPDGGSILATVRFEQGADTFLKLPVELLPDALQSYADLVSSRSHLRARTQVEANVAHHAEVTIERLTTAAIDNLRDSLNIAATVAFLDSVDDALVEVEQRTTVEAEARRKERSDLHEELMSELESQVRRLPHWPAVLARGAAFGAVGVGAFVALGQDLSPYLAPVALGPGLVLGLPVVSRYRAGRRAIRRIAIRYLKAVEVRMTEDVAQLVHDAVPEEVAQIRGRVIGGEESLAAMLGRRRADLAEVHAQLAQVEATRAIDGLTSTRFSTFVPALSSFTTESLVQTFERPEAQRLEELLSASLLRDWSSSTRLDPAATTHDVIDLFEGLVERGMWANLNDLLQESPSTLESAVTILKQKMLPLMRPADFVVAEEEIRRTLYMDVVAHGPAMARLRHEVSYDGNPQPITDADAAIVLSMRAFPILEGER